MYPLWQDASLLQLGQAGKQYQPYRQMAQPQAGAMAQAPSTYCSAKDWRYHLTLSTCAHVHVTTPINIQINENQNKFDLSENKSNTLIFFFKESIKWGWRDGSG